MRELLVGTVALVAGLAFLAFVGSELAVKWRLQEHGVDVDGRVLDAWKVQRGRRTIRAFHVAYQVRNQGYDAMMSDESNTVIAASGDRIALRVDEETPAVPHFPFEPRWGPILGLGVMGAGFSLGGGLGVRSGMRRLQSPASKKR